MKRSTFIKSLATTATGAALGHHLAAASQPASAASKSTPPADPARLPLGKQPNIIFVIVHDLGTHLGCYGTRVKSPHLDRIASDGIRLDRFFCSSTVCSPARGCLMTGLHSHVNGMMGLAHYGWRYNPGVRTAPEYLRDLGYHTIRAGFNHEGAFLNQDRRYDTDLCVDGRGFRAPIAVDTAIAYLKDRKENGGDRPFYLNVGMAETHPSLYTSTIRRDGLPGPLTYDYGGPVPLDEVTVPPQLPDKPSVRRYLAQFEASIRHMDTHVGRLYEAYKQFGYDRDTIFIFTTDHGMNGPRGKGTLYDHGLSVAGLVRMPDPLRRPGLVLPQILQGLDVTPTLIEAAGGKPPEQLHGRSFWPALVGKPYTPNENLFAQLNAGGETDYFPIRSVRTDRYRYVRHMTDRILHRLQPYEWQDWPDKPEQPDLANPWPPASYGAAPAKEHYASEPWPGYLGRIDRDAPREELYDHEKDPHGLHDIAGDPAYADVLKDLRTRVDTWMRDLDDVALHPEVHPLPPEKSKNREAV